MRVWYFIIFILIAFTGSQPGFMNSQITSNGSVSRTSYPADFIALFISLAIRSFPIFLKAPDNRPAIIVCPHSSKFTF